VKITLSTDARRDRREAVASYGAVSRSVRQAFTRDLDAALRYILEYPFGAPIRDREVRGKRLLHFPYTILYRIAGQHLFVVAIAHQARDPELYGSRFD
jgi:plasmid stabilization system protein ParE